VILRSPLLSSASVMTIYSIHEGSGEESSTWGTEEPHGRDLQMLCWPDVHKQTVECAIRKMESNGNVQVQVRQLTICWRWSSASKPKVVTHVAMESTGVFWKPIFNRLEGHFTVLLVERRGLSTRCPGPDQILAKVG
jgi:hypothetical protein